MLIKDLKSNAVLPVLVWGSSGCSGFLLLSKDMQVSSEMPRCVNLNVDGCLSLYTRISSAPPLKSAVIGSSFNMTLQTSGVDNGWVTIKQNII